MASEKEKVYRRDYYRNRYQNDPEFRERHKNSVRKYQLKKSDERIFAIFGKPMNSCEACGIELTKTNAGRRNLHLHHLSKEAYNNEHESNVSILCTRCHKSSHYLINYFGSFEKEKLLNVLRVISENGYRNVKQIYQKNQW